MCVRVELCDQHFRETTHLYCSFVAYARMLQLLDFPCRYTKKLYKKFGKLTSVSSVIILMKFIVRD